MKIIVDTNIVFSAILNQKSNIGKILIGKQKNCEFFSCNYLKEEISKYYPKIATIAGKDIRWVRNMERMVSSNISFIDEKRVIPTKIILESEEVVKDVDLDDILFVALTKYLKGRLWTGDKKLRNVLKSKGFNDVITTTELEALIQTS